jgi:hypothetical protein
VPKPILNLGRRVDLGRSEKRMREEFELALMYVLETDYDLDVRRANDKLNRRRSSAATLHFEYPTNGDPSSWKVLVVIEGAEESPHTLNIDYSSPDAMEESVIDCESLALAIGCYLEERRERRAVSGEVPGPQRRWDD